MATIKISNLRLRAIIGINDWEREKKQDIVINITMNYDATQATESDDIQHTVDYKNITKKVISLVESSSYYLIEKLTQQIINLIMEDTKVTQVTVQVSKPHALRFADNVSFELTENR